MNWELKIIISSSFYDGPSVMILKVFQLLLKNFFRCRQCYKKSDRQQASWGQAFRGSFSSSHKFLTSFFFCQGMKCYFKFLSGQSFSVGVFFHGEVEVFRWGRFMVCVLFPSSYGKKSLDLKSLGWKTGNKAVGDICALQSCAWLPPCVSMLFPLMVCGVLTTFPSLPRGESQQSHLLLLGQIHKFTKLKADEIASVGQLH